MADIPLRTYVQQLDNLIERKNVDEAIAHSRHILSFYPKHLDTYRMLGKALLEKGRHGDAADVFQRVLSVQPGDFISHVGMAIVREDEANLEAALWHMERAFEATPSNGAIQQELCRLYGRRDGVVPPKARLTRGALGRMYLQGGLYLQAEAELKAALNADPDRIDLQTILAQVYWYSDQPAAAAQLCGAILQSLPYSQVGNRILREIFRSRGRDSDAALYRQRLEALDPYEAMAAPAGDGATLSTADEVEADKVLVTRLDYVAGMESSGGPDWIASIGARFEEPLSRSASENTPDWLNTPAEPTDMPGTMGLPDWLSDSSSPAELAGQAAAQPAEGLPDWLNELSQTDAKAKPQAAADSDLPDWLQGATGPLDDAEVPAWMSGLPGAPAEASAEAAGIEETMPAWLAAAQNQADQPEMSASVPDWMSTLAPAANEIGSAPMVDPLPSSADADLPDWIKSAAPTGASDDDLPDWLKTSTGTLPPPTEPGAAAPWLADAESEPAAAVGTPSEVPEAVPDWMQTATAAPADDLPEWMQGAAPEAVAAAGPNAPAFEADPPTAAPSEDVPAWMSALAEPADELPAWMNAPAPEVSEPVTPAEPAGRSAEAQPAAGEDVPDWLAAVAAASPAGEVPAWMQTAPEPPTLSEAQPAEAEPEPASAPNWLDAIAPATPSAEVPAWLAAVAPVEPDPAPAEAEATPSDEMPDWLQAVAAASPSEAVPAWLQPSAVDEPEAAVPLTEAMADAPMTTSTAWPETAASSSAELETEALPPASATPSAEATPSDELPDWLRAVAPATPSEDVTAWMQTSSLDPETSLSTDAPAASVEPPAFEADAVAAVDAQLPGGSASSDDTPASGVPDWLRGLADDTEDKRTAHWEALADSEFGLVQPEDLEEDESEEPLQPLPEGIPDWLQAMARAAPPPDSALSQPPAEAEAPSAPPPTPTIELPDFLQLASAESIARADEPYALDEAAAETDEEAAADDEAALAPSEMPDWLRALAPDAAVANAPAPAFDSDVMAAAAAGLNLDEAPDWMKTATPAEAALPLSDLPLGDVPAWLQSAEPETPAIGAVDMSLDDAPDWLQEAAAVTPTIPGTGELTSPAGLAETPAWLPEAATADLPPWAQTEAPGATDTILGFLAGKDAEALKQLRRQAAQEDAMAALEADAPDHADQHAAGMTPVLSASEAPAEPTSVMQATEPAVEEPAVRMEPSLEDMSPDETMRWLESLAARQGADPNELFMNAPAEPAPAIAEPALAAEPVLTTETADEPPAPVAAGRLTEWLRETEATFEIDALADTAPHAKANQPTLAAELPDWLTTMPAEAELEAAEPALETPSSERPAWLAEMEALGADDPYEAPAVDAPATPAVPSEEAALRWLEEQAALAEAKAVPVQGLAETEGLDDLGVAAEAEDILPDIESMDAEAAMAWLEKLAAQQGASADELLTAPEDRPDEAPAWIVAAQQAEPQTEADRPVPEPGLVPEWLAEFEAAEDDDVPLEPAVLPDWLKPPAEPVAEPEAALPAAPDEPVPAIASAAPSGPDFASMDAEAAMAWLESLAAQQGADPSELLTAPEERPADAPAWVQAEQSAAELLAQSIEPPVETADSLSTPVMAAMPTIEPATPEPATPEPAVPEPPTAPAEPAAPDVDRLSRLSDRLAASRRAKEAEIEARFAQQRAEQEEARRLVWESMQAKKAAVESAIEALVSEPTPDPPAPPPVIAPEPIRPAAPARGRTGPLTPPPARPGTRPLPALPKVPDESAWVPALPPRPLPPSRFAGRAPATVLAEAQAHLQQQETAAAAEALGHLVGEGQLVDTVIVELEQVAAGPAAPAPLLRVLGDAYARSNRLQQALDTYRQALRRL